MKKNFISMFLAVCMVVSALTAGAMAVESKIEGEEDVTLEPLLVDEGENGRSKQYGSDGNLVITLDPGHGGYDPGAVYKWNGKNVSEKDLNLKIGLYCREELQKYAGVTVYMTRSTDTYVGLSDRVIYAEEHHSDIIVSLHNNVSNGSARGAMMLISNGNYRPELSEITQDIGSRLLEKLKAMGIKNLGFLRRNSDSLLYPNGKKADYYSTIRNATLQNISSMIIEHAFLDNYSDYSSFLSTDAKLKALGVADAQAIAEAYGLEKIHSAAANGDAPFTDVRDNQWYYDAVVFAYQNNLMAGTADTVFSPNMVMTRAMAVQVLYNYEGKPSVTGSNIFSDVQEGKWYYSAVCWASENGIAVGVGQGQFDPNVPVTREQLVQILYNYTGKPETAGSLSAYSDASSVAEWAETAMCWAVENHIISGTENNGCITLSPRTGATRAQAAAILKGYMAYTGK
ncbi:N-acetylmuramoyl-L-alanine amidase [Butyricicoccus sp.]|uniref:N-acetylmuramoyl-L-alanine amidase n=1 Tax=Butyricicoccus sp. TaxID=2049021 RepID=UPI003F15378C